MKSNFRHFVIDSNQKIIGTLHFLEISNNTICLTVRGGPFGIKGEIKINPINFSIDSKIDLPKSLKPLSKKRLIYYHSNFNAIVDFLKKDNCQFLRKSLLWNYCLEQLAIQKNISWAI